MAAPTNITEIGSGVYCYAAGIQPNQAPTAPFVLTERGGALYVVGWSSGIFDGGVVYGYALKSTDHGQTWTRLDYSNRPIVARGSNSTGPVVSLSWDQTKIAVVCNAIVTGSDTRAEIRIFDLVTEAWESGHAGASGAPYFTWFVDVVPVNTTFALVGRSDGTWLLVYTRMGNDGAVTHEMQFAVYDGAGTWSSADVAIVTRNRMSVGSGAYRYNLSMAALADDGFVHVWYDVTDFTGTNTYRLKRRTIVGATVGSEEEVYSVANGPITGTLPNISIAAHSAMARPIRWTSKGRIVIPIGLYSADASASIPSTPVPSSGLGHNLAGVLIGTVGGAADAQPLTFEGFGGMYSFQLGACERADGSLAVVFKNYLKTGTNANAYMIAEKSTAGSAAVVSPYLDIAAISGYDPRSQRSADTPADWVQTSFSPTVNAIHLAITPYSRYEDRVAAVLSLNRSGGGTPFPLHALWGDRACCCTDWEWMP